MAARPTIPGAANTRATVASADGSYTFSVAGRTAIQIAVSVAGTGSITAGYTASAGVRVVTLDSSPASPVFTQDGNAAAAIVHRVVLTQAQVPVPAAVSTLLLAANANRKSLRISGTNAGDSFRLGYGTAATASSSALFGSGGVFAAEQCGPGDGVPTGAIYGYSAARLHGPGRGGQLMLGRRSLMLSAASLKLLGAEAMAALPPPPGRTRSQLGARQALVPIGFRGRGANGSAAYYDATSTTSMDQTAWWTPPVGQVTAIQLVYAAWDMPQSGEADRQVTASLTAALSFPTVPAITVSSSAAQAGGPPWRRSMARCWGSTGSARVRPSPAPAAGSRPAPTSPRRRCRRRRGGQQPGHHHGQPERRDHGGDRGRPALHLHRQHRAGDVEGRRTLTIAPRHGDYRSDFIACSPAAGSQFLVRNFASFSGAGLQLMDYPGVQSGTATRLGGGVLRARHRADRPDAESFDAVQHRWRLFLPGGDPGTVWRHGGQPSSAWHAARPTAFAASVQERGQAALAIDSGITDVFLGFGRNDIEIGRLPATAVMSALATDAAPFLAARQRRVWACTDPPTTYSNDGYLTAANQAFPVATASTTATATASGGTTLAMASVANLAVGQLVCPSGSGTGPISAGTTISSVGTASIVLSQPLAATLAASSPLCFGAASASASPVEVQRVARNASLLGSYTSCGYAGVVDLNGVASDATGRWVVPSVNGTVVAGTVDGVHPSPTVHQLAVAAGIVPVSSIVS
ncbi:hypothetical protein HO133_003528 [Letharia lupina]|uniref:Uncharacterized protein n=1 Tax=Letharia lupina TaxID=560253 RepID=A0A8H6CA06_9LECA|nr:uncharacterized protein HO133_003528 [Letharia lupina]KAF6219703.1 hypothetical protein HO133_003528 [Letharia lupina]